jgi:hypothetical protein
VLFVLLANTNVNANIITLQIGKTTPVKLEKIPQWPKLGSRNGLALLNIDIRSADHP